MNSTQYSIFVYSKLVVKWRIFFNFAAISWLILAMFEDYFQTQAHRRCYETLKNHQTWQSFSSSKTDFGYIHCNTIKHKGTFRGPNVCIQPAANTSYFTNFIKEILLRLFVYIQLCQMKHAATERRNSLFCNLIVNTDHFFFYLLLNFGDDVNNNT